MATATATTNYEEYDPTETLSDLKLGSAVGSGPDFIPAIDLAGVDSDNGRAVIVEQIRRASSTVGFFQIVNHGVPLGVLERTMASVKGFFGQPTDIKTRFDRREMGTGISYFSNLELYYSKALANWRYSNN
jgi:isopenicillin N synthase-like dioxygenase